MEQLQQLNLFDQSFLVLIKDHDLEHGLTQYELNKRNIQIENLKRYLTFIFDHQQGKYEFPQEQRTFVDLFIPKDYNNLQLTDIKKGIFSKWIGEDLLNLISNILQNTNSNDCIANIQTPIYQVKFYKEQIDTINILDQKQEIIQSRQDAIYKFGAALNKGDVKSSWAQSQIQCTIQKPQKENKKSQQLQKIFQNKEQESQEQKPKSRGGFITFGSQDMLDIVNSLKEKKEKTFKAFGGQAKTLIIQDLPQLKDTETLKIYREQLLNLIQEKTSIKIRLNWPVRKTYFINTFSPKGKPMQKRVKSKDPMGDLKMEQRKQPKARLQTIEQPLRVAFIQTLLPGDAEKIMEQCQGLIFNHVIIRIQIKQEKE